MKPGTARRTWWKYVVICSYCVTLSLWGVKVSGDQIHRALVLTRSIRTTPPASTNLSHSELCPGLYITYLRKPRITYSNLEDEELLRRDTGCDKDQRAGKSCMTEILTSQRQRLRVYHAMQHSLRIMPTYWGMSKEKFGSREDHMSESLRLTKRGKPNGKR